jgi:hypothetical protein
MEMIRSKGEIKQFIKRSHSAVDQLDVGSTRGDRIKLARPVSFTRSLALGAGGRQQRRCGHQTNNLTTHRTLSIIKRWGSL